jgi:hypothetical protein
MRRDILGMRDLVERTPIPQSHAREQPKCNRAGECHRFAGEFAGHTSLLGKKAPKSLHGGDLLGRSQAAGYAYLHAVR